MICSCSLAYSGSLCFSSVLLLLTFLLLFWLVREQNQSIACLCLLTRAALTPPIPTIRCAPVRNAKGGLAQVPSAVALLQVKYLFMYLFINLFIDLSLYLFSGFSHRARKNGGRCGKTGVDRRKNGGRCRKMWEDGRKM